MNRAPTHYKRELKECKSCGKRSYIRVEARYMGIAMDVTTPLEVMQTCPKCGAEHKIAFKGVKETFPIVKRGLWRSI